MLYQISDLIRTAGPRKILDISDLMLEKGRITAIMGPNGAGKTTLLETLAFLETPSSGNMLFDNAPVPWSSSRALRRLRRRVVLVQQHPILFTTTVFKNIEYPLAVRKTPASIRYKRVEELLDIVDMKPFRSSKAHRLSGGETQRVAIARALACNPEVVLLDEPTANVDREHEGQIEGLIETINHTRGITVVFASHNLDQSARLADRTVFLHQGRVIQAAYENVFRAEITPEGKAALIGESGRRIAIHLPGRSSPGSRYIAIDPRALKIADQTPDAASHTELQGKVVELRLEKGRVSALVDVGLLLTVWVDESAFRESNIRIGGAVSVVLAPSGIEWL